MLSTILWTITGPWATLNRTNPTETEKTCKLSIVQLAIREENCQLFLSQFWEILRNKGGF